MENHKEIAISATRRAGRLLLDQWGGKTGLKISEKERYDFATDLDVRSEEIIVSTIKQHFPNHGIFSEESAKDSPKEGYRWIIDPLDGTTNYIHNYPAFAVSIALEYEGEIVLGSIYDPLRDEHFFGVRGEGAFLNNAPIHVSSVSEMEESLIATGFPIRCHQYLDPYLNSFKRLFDEVSGIRRCGAAALDLAYVACGRCDGFWEVRLSPWDIAAGSLLVQEAGGVISDFHGTEQHIWTGSVVAANQAIYHKILKVIGDVFERENLP